MNREEKEILLRVAKSNERLAIAQEGMLALMKQQQPSKGNQILGTLATVATAGGLLATVLSIVQWITSLGGTQ